MRRTLIFVLIVVAALVAIGALGVWFNLGPAARSATA